MKRGVKISSETLSFKNELVQDMLFFYCILYILEHGITSVIPPLKNSSISEVKDDIIRVEEGSITGASYKGGTYYLIRCSNIFTRGSNVYAYSGRTFFDSIIQNHYRLGKMSELRVLGLDGAYYFIHSVHDGYVVLSKYSERVHELLDFTNTSFKTVPTISHYSKGDVVRLSDIGTIELADCKPLSVHSLDSSDLESDYYNIIRDTVKYPMILDIIALVLIIYLMYLIIPILCGVS